jgi:hypothetical protein
VWDDGTHLKVWRGLFWRSAAKKDIVGVDYRYKLVMPNRPNLCLILADGSSIRIPGGLYRTPDQDLDAIVVIGAAAGLPHRGTQPVAGTSD